MKMPVYLLLVSVMMFLLSCGNKPKEAPVEIDPVQYKKNLENANDMYSQNEEVQIDDFIARNQWNMTKTGTGLRYMIYAPGNGRRVEDSTVVRFHYSLSLINGAVVEDSRKQGPKEILLGHGDESSGVEEGMLLLREGDKAKFVIPSYLAYGWLGVMDESKTIPSRAVLIYDVQVMQVRDYYVN